MIIDKRNRAQINNRTKIILDYSFVLISISNSRNIRKEFISFYSGTKRPFFFMINTEQFRKRLFPFSAHHAFYFRILFQHSLRIVRYLRTSKPDFCIRKNLRQFSQKLSYIFNIPQIAGNSQ